MRPPDKPPDDQDPDAPDPSPPSAEETARAATAKVVRELVLHAGASLPAVAAARVGELAEAAVEPLLAVLVDSKLRDPQGPASGWGPVHAAQLLGQLFPERAVEPLLDVLATTTELTPLRDAVSEALSPLGARLIAPILVRLPTAVGTYRRELRSLLAGVGVRDPRVLDQLLAALAESPEEGAMWLGEYGDRAALPHLSRALDAYRLGLADDIRGDSTVFELREAIQGLGGTLTPSQQAKYERARWARRVEMDLQSETRRQLPVRLNAPCPCGSGRLYRHCCLH